MKIGILGGSFDPIHSGHIDMAQKCLCEFGLDKIMFLPSGNPPHKNNITPKNIRIEMVKKAIENIPSFYLSRLEADRHGKTYTYDTAKWLKENTSDEFYYIIGGDSLNNLHSWYRAEELFSLIEFIVVDRQHIDEDDGICKKMGAKLYFSKYTGLDVSSTEIRQKVLNNENISNLVPSGVLEIIEKYGLYKNLSI